VKRKLKVYDRDMQNNPLYVDLRETNDGVYVVIVDDEGDLEDYIMHISLENGVYFYENMEKYHGLPLTRGGKIKVTEIEPG